MSQRQERQQELLNNQMDNVLEGLPPAALRDLARNDAASPLWRIAATAKLRKDGHPFANHPDLAELVWCIENNETFPVKEKPRTFPAPKIPELDKPKEDLPLIQNWEGSKPSLTVTLDPEDPTFPGPTVDDLELHADVADPVEPETEPEPGPFSASVTTKTLFQ